MTEPGWKAVPPDEQPAGQTAPMPAWVKPALGIFVVALLVLGWVIGSSLGRAGAPAESPEPSVEPTPTIALEPPKVVGDFVRGESNNSSGPAPENQQIARADYSDGEDTVVFVMTWPVADVKAFIQDAGIDAAQETAPGSGRFCGVSEDTGQSACAEVVDEVGLLLVAVSEQSQTAVSAMLNSFKEELGQ